MKEKFSIQVNNKIHNIEVDPSTPLLYILRNNLELNGPKFGCGLEQCGACMVLINDRATTSCRLPVASIKDQSVTTLEGLVLQNSGLHPLQESFCEEQAAQCGYCLNGMLISGLSLLLSNPDPGIEDIRNSLHLNLCRCGTHTRYIKAIQHAAKKMINK